MRLFVVALLAMIPLTAQQADQQLAREIFKELIEINTTDSVGDNTRSAEAMAVRFRQAGFPEADIRILSPAPRKGNLVVRLHGTSAARPILFIGHLDVVEANRSDWSFDPFEFREQDITRPFTVEGAVHGAVNMASPASPKDYLEHPIETLDVGSIGSRCRPAELPKLSRGQPGLRASSSMVTATAPFADRRTFCPSTSATRLRSI